MDKKVRLGKTDLEVNRIGFGGIPIQRLTVEESDRVVRKAVDSGINFFDTARVYTDSEEKLGRILHEVRDKVYIADKCFRRSAEEAAEDIDISLKNLNTDYIDLYQIHNISSEEVKDKVMGPGGAYEALVAAKKQGKIRHIGVTGHKPWILMEVLEKFETVQFPMNYIECDAQKELLPRAKELGLGTIAMKPVAGGALKNVSLNLRYIFEVGMDVAIPGMDHPDQVVENVKVMDNPEPLSEDEKKLLEAEKKELGEDFCRRCEYCMPCPEGLNISFLHLIKGYYFRYGLKEWSKERLAGLEKSYGDCIGCGVCVERCPYGLDMPRIFAETAKRIKF